MGSAGRSASSPMSDLPVIRALHERLVSPRGNEAAFQEGLLGDVGNNLGWLVGTLWLPDERDELLQPACVWHAHVHEKRGFSVATRAMVFTRGKGLPGRVWIAAEPVWIADVTVERNFPRAPAARVDGLHSAVGFPLTANGRVTGVMEYFTNVFRVPMPLFVDLFREIGAMIGPAFEGGR